MKNKKNKNKTVIATLIAVVVLLSAVCTVSIAYNFLGGFYYCRVIHYDTMLGEEQTVIVYSDGAFVSSCNFSGSLVVGADIKQVVNVQTQNLNQPLYLRAKYHINGIVDQSGIMFGFANWQQGLDGYLYYNQTINSYSKVGLCNTIRLGVQQELKSSTNYVLTFVVEASVTDWDYEVV